MELKWIYITYRHTVRAWCKCLLDLKRGAKCNFFMKTMRLDFGLEEGGQTVDYLVHSDFDTNHLTISKV